jgi:MFS family permease
MHLSRALAGLPYSLYIVMSALPGVLVAVLVRWIGVRGTVVLGSLLILAGCLLMGTVVSSAIGATLVFGVMVAFGVCAGGVFGTQPGVMVWFVRQRGLAMAIIYAGGAIGGFVAPLVLDWAIGKAGGNWRAGWWLYGALAAISTVLAAAFIRERPSDLGQEPYGAEAAPQMGGAPAGAGARLPAFITVERWTFAEVMRSGRYWIMVLALCGGSAGYTLFLSQGRLHLLDLGFHPGQAGLAVSVVSISALIGKAPLALFGDRLDPRYIWAITSAVFGLGFLLVIHPHSMFELYVFSICIGIGWGGCIVGLMTTIGNYYGQQAFAAAAGVAGGVNTVISFFASNIGGIVFDKLHSYAPTLISLAVWCFAGAIALALVGRPHRGVSAGATPVPVGSGT